MANDSGNDAEIKPNNLDGSSFTEDLYASNLQREMAGILRQSFKEAPPKQFKFRAEGGSLAQTKIVPILKNASNQSPNIYSESILKSAGQPADAGHPAGAGKSQRKIQLAENQQLTDIANQGDSFAQHDEHKSRATVLENNLYPAGDSLAFSNNKSIAYKTANSYNSHPSEHNFLLDS